MSIDVDRLSVALTGAPDGCVAYEHRKSQCPHEVTHMVTLSYCEHNEQKRVRCPDPDVCPTATPYHLRVCATHEAAIRCWICWIESEAVTA